MIFLSSEFSQISRHVFHEIMTDCLGYQKLCSLWISLSDLNRTQRGSALQFLTQYSDEGDAFSSQIVTGDVIWVSQIILEFKQQSMKWTQMCS